MSDPNPSDTSESPSAAEDSASFPIETMDIAMCVREIGITVDGPVRHANIDTDTNNPVAAVPFHGTVFLDDILDSQGPLLGVVDEYSIEWVGMNNSSLLVATVPIAGGEQR